MITVEYGDGYVRVSPEVPVCLRKALRYFHRERVGRRYTKEWRAVYTTGFYAKADQSIGEYLLTPPGMIWRIRKTLTEFRIPFQVVDTRLKPPRLDPREAIKALRDYQIRPVIEMIAAQGGIGQFPTGYGKCLRGDVPVKMHDNRIVRADRVQIGDLVKGPDGSARPVIRTYHGIDQMYEIRPDDGGMIWACNSEHILHMERIDDPDTQDQGEVVEMPVHEYLVQSDEFKQAHKQVRAGDPKRVGFKVRPIGPGVYYGFTVGGCDELFLLGDDTICHNTHIAAAMIRSVNRQDLIERGTPLSVLAVASKDINKKNWQSLVEIMPEREVGICMSGATRHTEDVMCVTLDSLERVEPDRVGLLIVDEAHEAGSATRSETIMKATRARRWGLSATPVGRSDGSDMITESVLGPVVSSRTYQDGVDVGALVPITVFMVATPEPPNWGGGNRDAKVRIGITENEAMYRMAGELLRRIPDSMQTLLLAPHVRNLHKLKQYAPEVPEVHAETNADKLTCDGHYLVKAITAKERQRRYDAMASGEYRKCMSTYVYKQGVDFPNLEVVICIGGGGSQIVSAQIPGRASRNIAGKDHAIVIDFTRPWDVDTSGRPKKDGPLRRNDKERRRIYNKLGFRVIEVESINQIPFLTGGHS